MSEIHHVWLRLRNPFLSSTDPGETIKCRVSGRSTDIIDLLASGNGAIILAGAPRIGKSELIHYLQDESHTEWSWRKEIAALGPNTGLELNTTHFVQIDLRPLETIEKVDELLGPFITQCALALQSIYPADAPECSTDLKGLRKFLRAITHKYPDAHHFLMLDTIESLDRPDIHFAELANSGAKTATERGLALLNYCEAIRVLVDLIDEFSTLGVILSIEGLPRSKSVDQYTHVSADLARFTTMPLQIFTWDDSINYLKQGPQDFEQHWAQQFSNLSENIIFTPAEQEWILEQAGTHPYLLRQFCFKTFHSKQVYASIFGAWKELQGNDKGQIIEAVTQRVSTFLSSVWKRLQEALDTGTPDVRSKFNDFVGLLASSQAYEELSQEIWEQLGAELHYILYSEGIIRYDLFHPIHFPGAILCNYLVQKANETGSPVVRNFYIAIRRPGSEIVQFGLSEIEYGLIKTLKRHPTRCLEEELIKGAWGKPIERSAFTQRIHHLRKKLKEFSDGNEMIINHYGGQYSLNHPEWLYLE